VQAAIKDRIPFPPSFHISVENDKMTLVMIEEMIVKNKSRRTLYSRARG